MTPRNEGPGGRENIVQGGAEETEGLEEFYKRVGADQGNGSGVTQKELSVDSQLTENDYQLQYGARSRLRPMICVLVTNCAKAGLSTPTHNR